MTKKWWKRRIQAACEGVGTYKPENDPVIETLADILEKRDAVNKQYMHEGKIAIVEHTNKNGSTNRVKNPLLALYNELNRDALSYWKELGLTPAGLRKIKDADPTTPTRETSNVQKLIAALEEA